MCAILGWKGIMPKGMISKLLNASESRGRDSTGLAFRAVENGVEENANYVLDEPASVFVSTQQEILSQARRSTCGIGHTRRASPGMPVNCANAHPFRYPLGSLAKIYFAHNGKIDNWRELAEQQYQQYMAISELKSALLTSDQLGLTLLEEIATHSIDNDLSDPIHLEADTALRANSKEEYLDYRRSLSRALWAKRAATDSMLLGSHIEKLDFAEVEGCFSLVWLWKDQVYHLRSNKESIFAYIVWKNNDSDDDKALTLVASTKEIVEASLAGLEIDYSVKYIIPTEGVLYRLAACGAEVMQKVALNAKVHPDDYSSAKV